ncbi:MAG: hypothetical protein MMC23_004429 [Stictis urceolatum]|nr:hypothetical protein [Stictis urceolata]
MYSHAGHPSASSPHHALIATIHSSTLTIRSTTAHELILSKPLDPTFSTKCKTLRFYRASSPYPKCSAPPPPRLLLASDTTAHIYDALSPSFHAEIKNAAQPTSRIAHISFLSPNHVLVIPDFAPKATIYDLGTGLALEIRDPKAPRGGNTFSVRPRTGHVALLARNDGKDVLVVLNLRSDGDVVGEVEANFTLEALDAQGVRWSPDGRWMVVWEMPGLDASVWVYTADGQLFRRWSGGESVENVGLGVRVCEWDAGGSWLWCGMGDGRVVGLGTRTFLPVIEITHPATITSSISPSSAPTIYQEQISASPPYTRAYAPALLPAIPPSAPPPSATTTNTTTSTLPSQYPSLPSHGITHLFPSPHETHLASISASTPTTVHIHTLSSLPSSSHSLTQSSTPPILTQAILIHHSPIRSLTWHPSTPGLLLIHSSNSAALSRDGKTVRHWAHIWDERCDGPQVVYADVPAPPQKGGVAQSMGSRQDVSAGGTWSWVGGQEGQVLLGTAQGCVLADVSGNEGAGVRREESGLEESVEPRAEDDAGSRLLDRGNADGADFLRSSVPITGEGPEDAFDEGYSMDLSPVRLSEVGIKIGDEGNGGKEVDDTFGFKKRGLGVR